MCSSHSSQTQRSPNQGLAVRGLADRSSRWRSVTGATSIVAPFGALFDSTPIVCNIEATPRRRIWNDWG